MPETPEHRESLRAAEVIASVCLATDLGMEFPLEHGFQATLMASRLCEILGVDSDTSRQVYYGSMMMYSGCTSEAALGKPVMSGDRIETLIPNLFGNTSERAAGLLRSLPPSDATPLQRPIEVARRLPRLIKNTKEQQTALCEVAEILSQRLGLPSDVHGLFVFLTERWDGKSVLRRAEGEEIPPAVRIFILVRDIAFQRLVGGDEHAIRVARERAGGAFDPRIASTYVEHAPELFATADEVESTWEQILAAEPKPWIALEGDEIDRAIAAIGDFADLISPTLAGHSTAVADLVYEAGPIAGMTSEDARTLRRAAHVHDIGRVAIGRKIWEKEGPLNRDEWEQVRLHPYQTERVLSQSPFFASLADIARGHHERLDGSGYHRGVDAKALDARTRMLAAADTFVALTEFRSHRSAMSPTAAAQEVARLADDGRLDHTMVASVLEAAGQEVPEMEAPAGLTERESEVIGLLARGLQTKQIAAALGIAAKTADTHIQAAYRKMGVSTRASATLFAMEHGLLPPGEFLRRQ